MIILLFLAKAFSIVLCKRAWQRPAQPPKNIAHTGLVKYSAAVQLATPPATKQLIISLATTLPFMRIEIAVPTTTDADIAYQIESGAKMKECGKISVSIPCSGSVTKIGKNVNKNRAPKNEIDTEVILPVYLGCLAVYLSFFSFADKSAPTINPMNPP